MTSMYTRAYTNLIRNPVDFNIVEQEKSKYIPNRKTCTYKNGDYAESSDEEERSYRAYEDNDPDYEPFDLEKHKAWLRSCKSNEESESEDESEYICDTESDEEEEEDEEEAVFSPKKADAWDFKNRTIQYENKTHDLISFLTFYTCGKHLTREAHKLYTDMFVALMKKADDIKAGEKVSYIEYIILIKIAEAYTKKHMISLPDNKEVLGFVNQACMVLNRIKKYGNPNGVTSTVTTDNYRINFEKDTFVDRSETKSIRHFIKWVQLSRTVNQMDLRAYDHVFNVLYNCALDVKAGKYVSEEQFTNMKEFALLFAKDPKQAKRAYHAVGMLRKYGKW